MNDLAGRHAGETAIIVGCGPSVLIATRGNFLAGPVIVLNHAILVVRLLQLPNIAYSMQKDGCVSHRGRPLTDPPVCVCPSTEMVTPLPPEELILSTKESAACFIDYPYRHVIDVQADLGLPWWTSSSPTAVQLAATMGCVAVVMIGHDAYTIGRTDRIFSELSQGMNEGYVTSGHEAQAQADKAGMRIEWL